MVGGSFTYRGPIRISEGDMTLALDGRKRCTIRKGLVDVSSPRTKLVSRTRSLSIEVERIERGIAFEALDESHAKGEGLETIAELHDDLRKYYPDLRQGSVLTVIWFRSVATSSEATS